MSDNSKKRPISAQDLRAFYFSRSANFNSFQTRQQVDQLQKSGSSSVPRGNNNINRHADGSTPIASGSAVRAVRSSHIDQSAIPSSPSSSIGGDEVTENHQQQQYQKQEPTNTTTSGTLTSNNLKNLRPVSAAAASNGFSSVGRNPHITSASFQGGEGVSSSYLGFLQDQQQILKTHQYVKGTVESATRALEEHRDHFKSLTDECEKLLHRAEESTGWNWRSKFSREQLIQDAALDVPFDELLRQEDIPNVAALQHLLQNMHKLRHELAGVARQQSLTEAGQQQQQPQQSSSSSLSNGKQLLNNSEPQMISQSSSAQRFQPFFALLEQGARKVERFISEFGQSNIDATPIAKLPDTLLVQLDNSLRIPPLSRILEESLLRLEGLESKRQECIQVREQAIEEGNMDVAERQSFQLAELSEESTATIQEKLKILERVAEEHAVLQKVCSSYSQGFINAVENLEIESSEKKRRCEEDLGRLYTLKKKMEDVEKNLRERWEKSKIVSDDKLSHIDVEQSKVWAQLVELTKQFAALEEQRHAECKRRVEEKAAEEGRRNDFDVFIKTVENYAKSLERTVSNMDLKHQSTQIMADFVRGGFSAIQKDISNLKTQVETELFEAHKSHLSAFRNLIFILGELEYRKERKVEEIGVSIQNAHIQLELCSDSLNIQAKRFADERNELTKKLHLVEHEVEKLRERQQTALAHFAPSSAALHQAGFDHEHPLTELEEWKLETRSRMVDYRAVAVGGVRSKPLRKTLGSLSQALEESRSKLFHHSRSAATTTSGVHQQHFHPDGMNQSHY